MPGIKVEHELLAMLLNIWSGIARDQVNLIRSISKWFVFFLKENLSCWIFFLLKQYCTQSEPVLNSYPSINEGILTFYTYKVSIDSEDLKLLDVQLPLWSYFG